MKPEERQKLVNMFKNAIAFEEVNIVAAQKDCLRDWRKIFAGSKKEKQKGEKILNKLILDSLNHAQIFANLVIKIYQKYLR